MASISRGPNGRRTIQFTAADGRGRSIRLGKVSQRIAEEVKVKVEHLNAAAVSNLPLDSETAQWVAKLGDDLAAKLAAAGLISGRQSAQLGPFLAEFIKRRGIDKPRTRINLDADRCRLIEFFGADRSLRSVTPGDADAYLAWLKQRYASGTAARTFRRGRQFFRAAVRSRLLDANPFDGVKTPSEVDTSKQAFVTAEVTCKVIEECSSADLRLIVALARFGGIRVPSEYLHLTWKDVLWDRERVRITSPKTEHHEGRGERWIPLFPELKPFLEEAFEAAHEGSVHVIGEAYRNGEINLRTVLQRAIRRAGVESWPKLFVNLRSSRETELVERFPLHVVTAWLGNTARIAQKHYLQVTDEHFSRAAKSGATVLQNPVQQPAASPRVISQDISQTEAGCDLVPCGAMPCEGEEYPGQESNPEPLVRSER